MKGRPENQLPAELYYNEEEAKKYTNCSRIIKVQAQLAERCIELLNLPKDSPGYILDIGCGSGLSGEVIEKHGHLWMGFDISRDMLNVAKQRNPNSEVYQIDAGQGFNFRSGVFDGAISVSAIQWLCVASKKAYNPWKRCLKFFTSLYNCLSGNSRAVLQFYPEGPEQIEMLTSAAMKAGFRGGLVVDFPNSAKAKKQFLVLTAGGAEDLEMQCIKSSKQLEAEAKMEGEQAMFLSQKSKKIKKHKFKKGNFKPKFKTRAWILNKKAHQRVKGNKVRKDTKYTGRRRNMAF